MAKDYTITISDKCAGLAEVPGFMLAGVACDIRNKNDMSRLDLAVIRPDKPSVCAGVFTTNDVKAAPVLVDMEHLNHSCGVGAIVVNSGNANACTGEAGMKAALAMCERVAKTLDLSPTQVLVCSTGRIGAQMPMEKIAKGIDEACGSLNSTKQSGVNAAEAILTSDTKIKVVCAKVLCEGRMFTLAAMAKGSGMIEPNMATMLAFVGSDVDMSQATLKAALAYASSKSFNKITIDGDMSTNDTALAICSGVSGIFIEPGTVLFSAFQEALTLVCKELARKMVADGERITKVVEMRVEGAASAEQAEKIARAICNSLLVKSSWYGSDPNWGRIFDAAGYAKTGMKFEKSDMFYNETPVILKGEPQDSLKPQWKEIVAKKEFVITLNLNMGDYSESILATDLSEAYVDFNKGE